MRETLEFMMYDWLKVDSLSERERYAAHTRETFQSVLDLSERIATEKFHPLNRLVDAQEPEFDNGRVRLPGGVKEAVNAYANSGLLAAGHDYEVGGMQLPYVVDMAANTFFSLNSIGLAAFGMLTYANANLLMAHGTEAQRSVFALPQMEGRYFGTMCLSEPGAGSSLGDLTTKALPDGQDYADCPLGPRYRLKGSKMWISGAEHDLSENIVHLVLAKIPDESGQLPPGPGGISLFIVPKYLVTPEGGLTEARNDVVLAGLNHKLGYRGIPNTLLSFGESGGAIGYRVGEPGQGLHLMFHMMNEARINIGMGATMLGFAGYQASLDYARERRQGRLRGSKGRKSDGQQVKLIEHPDVRRMLLAQKSLSEGGLALALYCARLVDEKRTGDEAQRKRAGLMLELLTPVAKSWASEWCLEANSLAIQVLGGYGYTRDFPVEQYWRDNRLNMIHEGTHGIQALDLLGRKIRQNDGQAYALWVEGVQQTLEQAKAHEELEPYVDALAHCMDRLSEATRKAQDPECAERALANATPYMQAFGHVVVAWLWLQVLLAALESPTAGNALVQGKRMAMRYFFAYELSKVASWLDVILKGDDTVLAMQGDWF
ncbi:acyl-CoA dehydrogenase [Pollutimonas sp. H1-120]|uniref:acyl-CoA dehydrogenase n=1 Tax=Pollutimonas sp. H1-120 TaxID=3148824 RepID=UPI003B51AFB8